MAEREYDEQARGRGAPDVGDDADVPADPLVGGAEVEEARGREGERLASDVGEGAGASEAGLAGGEGDLGGGGDLAGDFGGLREDEGAPP